jgi:hypothetical protein
MYVIMGELSTKTNEPTTEYAMHIKAHEVWKERIKILGR